MTKKEIKLKSMSMEEAKKALKNKNPDEIIVVDLQERGITIDAEAYKESHKEQ